MAASALVAPTVRVRLADYAHEAWSGWMRYLFEKCKPNPDGSVTIPVELVERWSRQVATPYAALPDNEQASDLAEADKMLAIAGNVDALVRAARSALSATRGYGRIGDVSCRIIADQLEKALEAYPDGRGNRNDDGGGGQAGAD